MKELLTVDVVAPLSIGLFLAIVFLQSGIDKLVDRKGNLAWLKGHFEKSILGGTVSMLLTVVTFMEIATGLMAIWGVICLFLCDDPCCIFYASILALLTLLMLLFGQRVAKDYEGAKTIAIYFGVVLLGLMFL